jgi:hypothetical protein
MKIRAIAWLLIPMLAACADHTLAPEVSKKDAMVPTIAKEMSEFGCVTAIREQNFRSKYRITWVRLKFSPATLKAAKGEVIRFKYRRGGPDGEIVRTANCTVPREKEAFIRTMARYNGHKRIDVEFPDENAPHVAANSVTSASTTTTTTECEWHYDAVHGWYCSFGDIGVVVCQDYRKIYDERYGMCVCENGSTEDDCSIPPAADCVSNPYQDECSPQCDLYPSDARCADNGTGGGSTPPPGFTPLLVTSACSPTAVQRGSYIACAGSANQPTFAATWTFTPNNPDLREVSDNSGDTSWGGTLVASGDITFEAASASEWADAAPVSVTATPRSWPVAESSWSVGYRDGCYNLLKAQFVDDPGELGITLPKRSCRSDDFLGPRDGYTIATVAYGPNSGFLYVTSANFTLDAHSQLSQVYSTQYPSYAKGGCAQFVTIAVYNTTCDPHRDWSTLNLWGHENAHVDVLQTAAREPTNNIRQGVEDVVGSADESAFRSLIETRRANANLSIFLRSKAIDDDHVLYPPKVFYIAMFKGVGVWNDYIQTIWVP